MQHSIFLCNYWLTSEVELLKYVSLLWISPSDGIPYSVWQGGVGGCFCCSYLFACVFTQQ